MPVKDILAYLEKQKDINCLACDQHLKGYLAGRKVTEEEKQKEQKPELPKPHKGDDNNPYDMRVSEAQEYAIKRGFGIPFNDGEVYVDERHITQTIGNILRWADEHPKEQKPAGWSEEDELAKRHLEGYIMGREDTMREMKDFLESHFNCENAKKGTPIVYNTQSGTSTLKAEG